MPENARVGTGLLNPVCQISVRALQGIIAIPPPPHFINEETDEKRFSDLSLQFTQLIHGGSNTQIWSESLVHAAAYPSGCCQSNFAIVQL